MDESAYADAELAAMGNLGRFRPSGEDFLHLPLPQRWHGAFYALRPFLWTIRKVRKAFRPVGLLRDCTKTKLI